jgi:hypothetical protein
MINIKDFKPGTTAFVLGNGRADRYRNDDLITETEVISVGRKYVHTNVGKYLFFNNKENFLAEEVDYGQSRYLFLTRESIEKHVERKSLLSKITNTFERNWGSNKLDRFTLEQLRRIMAIIKEADNNQDTKGE